MTNTRLGAVLVGGLALAGGIAAGVVTMMRRRRPWYRRMDQVLHVNGARAQARRLVRR